MVELVFVAQSSAICCFVCAFCYIFVMILLCVATLLLINVSYTCTCILYTAISFCCSFWYC